MASCWISLAFSSREQELGLSSLFPSFLFLMQISLTNPRTVLHVIKVAGYVMRSAVPKPSPCLFTAA